jgi:hypothetical protein
MLRPVATLAFLGATVSAADMFPFVLPWDDSAPGIISLAPLNEKPAGSAGFLQIKDGHLFAGEKRLRIFGVNTCFGANFPTHEGAEKVAARMAKFGINCVRFHHMDMMSSPGGIFAKDGKTLDPERLDRLDYFIAKLKENGIYADLNLHVSRTYPDRPKAEKKSNPDYDKGVDNYCAAMIALQKEYARDLLTHKNAYTGKTYAEEPAVALVEINNENALGFQWWAGQMDDLPAPYAAELEQLWTAWLKNEYQTDERARAAWSEGAREPGPEMLEAGREWNHEQHGGAVAKAGQSEGRVRVEVETAGTESWHVQFNRAGLKVDKGETYEARFRARAPKETTISVALQQTRDPWKILGSANVKVGTEWKDVSAVIKSSETESAARFSIGGMGKSIGAFEFESFSLRAAGVDGTLTRNADGSVPLTRKRELARHTKAKQLAWQKFIWDTETAYWNGMRNFLKKDLGVKTPVVGTQGFWSPAHVQAGMDVIDSHAYWHHPDFQGRGWNQDVWTVKNESMAGAAEGGELARLAAQRVEGKPFICTEYNHPAPNTYSAETFPLLLAFAAAQDWDGVFAFSYSHRGDAWDQPAFNNFFDIDRHTAKMATLPAAVGAFRRGDLSSLESCIVLQLGAGEMLESGIKSGPGFMRQRPEFKTVDLFTTRFSAKPTFSDSFMERDQHRQLKPKPQLVWDTENHRALVDSPRTKLLVGRVPSGMPCQIGDVTIVPGETRQGWGCFQLTVIDGPDFATAKRILITATGDTENTGQTWTGPDKTSVGRAWGEAPVLVEAPAAEVLLPGTGRLRAWALDETGQRREEVAVEGNRIVLGAKSRTLWHEVVRE